MARTVNPQQHAARRAHITDAAFTCFARDGYTGATTAAICQTAGIGSGTFFHYFDNKVSVLLAVLELGTQQTQEWFAVQEGRDDPREVVLDWVRHSAAAATDPRLPGFVRAVGAVATEPDVAAALAADELAQCTGLQPWVAQAQLAGAVRVDLSEPTLTSWVMLMLDGYLGRLAADDRFTGHTQHLVLIDAVTRLLATPIQETTPGVNPTQFSS
jgi:AcrR family transcriptional regulator